MSAPDVKSAADGAALGFVQTALPTGDNVLPTIKQPTGEEAVSRYIVRFMKDVLGGNGRQIEICQRSIEIDATNEAQAEELAKLKFCESERLCEWSLHADRIQVGTDIAA